MLSARVQLCSGDVALPLLSLLALLASPVELSWEASEACPGVGELDRAIDAWIAASPELEAEVHVRGRVSAWAGGYQLDLNIGLGSREQGHVLRSHDCAELTDLAALLIASAIDPFVLGRGTDAEIDVFEHLDAIVIVPERLAAPVERSPEGEPEEQPDTGPIETRAPELEGPAEPEESQIFDPVDGREFGPITALEPGEPRRARPRIEGFLAASGLGYAGLFQRPSGGVELYGGIDRGALRIAVGAAGWFGGQFRSSEGVGGNLQAGSALLEVCGVPSLAPRSTGRSLGFPVCASGTAGAIVGQGAGVASPALVVRPWAALGADVGLRWRVHPRVALRLGVGVLANLIRPVWEVAGPIVSFTTPPVTGRVRLALELVWGRR